MSSKSNHLTGFRELNARVSHDYDEWLNLFSASQGREPHSHPAYSLILAPSDSEPLCVASAVGRAGFFMPLWRREIPDYGYGVAERLHDSVTPYGYGGAYQWGQGSDATAFWAGFELWADASSLVTHVTRCSPFLEDPKQPPGDVITRLSNVSISLKDGFESAWDGAKPQTKRDARRAERDGVVVQEGSSDEALEAFHDLYLETMMRNGAADFYFFNLDDMRRLRDALAGDFAVFTADAGGEVVAADVVLCGVHHAYFFLSGSSERGRRSRANALLRRMEVAWLAERGLQEFLLGGGMSESDSLFRSKAVYAPDRVLEFQARAWTLNSVVEEQLVAARRASEPAWHPRPDFAPRYRAPGVEDSA